jgi:CHAT domain-containing protein/Tfp pilus assembly protein PilF
MKACLRNRLLYVVCIGVFSYLDPASSWAQQPSTFSGPQAPPATPNDPVAQIDELLKKANDAVFVKGQLKEAEEESRQALDLSQKLGDKARTLRALIALGTACAYQFRWTEGLDLDRQAIQLARELGDKKALTRSINNAATALRYMGHSDEALNSYYQTVALAKEVGDLQMEWTALRNIGALYYETGESDRAEAPLREALRLAREIKNKVLEALSLDTLGLSEMDREHYPAALNYYQQSLDLKPENPLVMAQVLNNMGITHELIGESKKAAEVLQQALKTQEASGNGTNPIILSNLGDSQLSLGQLADALASEERALALIHQSGGMTQSEWYCEKRIGKVQHAMGHNEEALSHYRISIDDLERIRPGVLATESGRATVNGSHAVFTEAADLLFDMHRETEALEVAERGRARGLLDLLAESQVGLADEMTPEQRQREESVLGRIAAAQKGLWKEKVPPEEEKKQKAELASAEEALEVFHREMRLANPRYASIRYPDPITVSHIQKDLLDANTVLVDFLLGEKRSFVWAISKNNVATAILAPRKEIEEQAASYRKLLTQRASALTLSQSTTEINSTGAKLYSSLLQPLERALASSRTLVIVPDGALDYLPFEALVANSPQESSGNKKPLYLVEKFAIVYGPSASALSTIQEMNRGTAVPPKMLLAFGDPVVEPEATLAKTSPATGGTRSADPAPDANAAKPTASTTVPSALASPDPGSPDTVSQEYVERGFSLTRLPFARDEVLGIGNLYPVAQRQVYLGEDAREETVKSEKLDAYRYIHFASHGFIDESKPGRSGILLSRDAHSAEDGILQMGEIMRLRLKAELVTLSACSTGLGKLVSGEGILGLTRAFFYSGARNVTVSLWNVNDSSTSTLMKAFYESLNQGLSKGAALRQAKLTLLRGKEATWHHPYYWAAFVMVGEGK